MAFATISVQLDIMVPMCIGERRRSDAYASHAAHTHAHTHTDHTQLFGVGVLPTRGERAPDQAAVDDFSERLNHPGGCEREAALALLATTSTRWHTTNPPSNQNLQKLSSKRRTNASIFTFKPRRLSCCFALFGCLL